MVDSSLDDSHTCTIFRPKVSSEFPIEIPPSPDDPLASWVDAIRQEVQDAGMLLCKCADCPMENGAICPGQVTRGLLKEEFRRGSSVVFTPEAVAQAMDGPLIQPIEFSFVGDLPSSIIFSGDMERPMGNGPRILFVGDDSSNKGNLEIKTSEAFDEILEGEAA